jgi:phosphatidylethanolamine-binding protein (PEBP) family uncharacterized protein
MKHSFKLLLCAGALLTGLSMPAQAADFKASFQWGDIPLCTSGQPNIVDNPRFRLFAVPEGTKYIYFRMVDLDVPNYDHGGGWVKHDGSPFTEPGAFQYKSPCPPSGVHNYQWQIFADTNSIGSDGYLAVAKTEKKYPK